MDANENHPINGNEVQQNRHRAKTVTPIPIVLLLILIPILMLLWLGNTALVVVPTKHNESVPLTRWLVAVFFPCFISYWGLKKRKLNLSGAVIGFFSGFIMTLSSYIFAACMLMFFIIGNVTTHFQSDFKCRFQEKHKQDVQRGWRQVTCNSAMAVQVALLYILDTGSGERPIDFRDDYRESWFGLAVLGTLACCCGDTCASELGIVVGSESPRLITTFRKVPRGTNGGVSLPGLLFSFLGGLSIGLVYYITLICTVDSLVLHQSPPQWPIVLWGGFAGFVGGLFDSFCGATLQYTGTNGGVTQLGLLLTFLGRLVIGLAYYIALICTVESLVLHQSPPQWPIILWGGFAGLVGGLFDSLFGAVFEYSGLDEKTGIVIIKQPRKGVKHISGMYLLDNHCVNLLAHIVTGFLTPQLASLLWP